jgi:hypothetical protein
MKATEPQEQYDRMFGGPSEDELMERIYENPEDIIEVILEDTDGIAELFTEVIELSGYTHLGCLGEDVTNRVLELMSNFINKNATLAMIEKFKL